MRDLRRQVLAVVGQTSYGAATSSECDEVFGFVIGGQKSKNSGTSVPGLFVKRAQATTTPTGVTEGWQSFYHHNAPSRTRKSSPDRSLLPREDVEVKEEEVRAEFQALVESWYQETGHISSIQEKVMHPSYQRIIGMGRPAIPLVLQELRERPNFWFWALRFMTGEDPSKNAKGINNAVEAWSRWGAEHGYLQGS